MKERKADLFEVIFENEIDAICITTNGNFMRNGNACMFGGCAKVAADRWPAISKRLGQLLRQTGSNVPFVIGALDENGKHITPTRDLIKNNQFKCLIFSFPTINQSIN